MNFARFGFWILPRQSHLRPLKGYFIVSLEQISIGLKMKHLFERGV